MRLRLSLEWTGPDLRCAMSCRMSMAPGDVEPAVKRSTAEARLSRPHLAVCMMLVLGVWLRAAPVRSATLFDPAQDWQTLATEHFRIHHPAIERERALKAAQVAERVHGRLVAWLGHAPKRPTQVVLLDHEDTANGFALALPNNAVYLYLTPPGPEVREFARDEAWFEALFTHEYTHLLHFETTGGLVALADRILGRALFPNFALALPFGLIEGMAVLGETAFTPGGRGRTAEYDMMARMAALAGDLPGLDRIGGYHVAHWPGGSGVYAFGTMFMEWGVLRWGPDFPRKLAEAYGSEPWWGIDEVFRKVTGSTLTEAWEAWRTDALRRAERQRRQLLEQGPFTGISPVTTKGGHQRHPFFLPDGTLGWHDWDGHGFAAVRGGQGWPDALTSFNKTPFTALRPTTDGKRLYHVGMLPLDGFQNYNDVLVTRIADGTTRRLTVGLRVTDVLPLPSGELVGVATRQGRPALVRMDAGGSLLGWHELPVGAEQAEGLAWDGKGRRLVMSLSVAGGRDLWTLEPERGVWQAVTRDQAVEIDPAMGPDGTLYFASDRSGVWNVYAMEPGAAAIRQVTHMLGGAFEPAVSPDGRTLAYVTYGATGHDIATMSIEPANWRRARPEPLVPSDGEGDFVPLPGGEAARLLADHVLRDLELPAAPAPAPRLWSYSPLDSLLPKAWVGILGPADEQGWGAGMTLLGSDALLQHALSLSLGAGIQSGRPFAGLSWTYDGLPPTIGVWASTGTRLYPGTTEGARREDRVGVSLTMPGLPSRLISTLRIDGGYATVAFDSARSQVLPGRAGLVDPALGLPAPGQTSTLTLRYQYGNTWRFLRSVSPEGGRLAVAELAMSDPMWGSVSRFLRMGVEGRLFLPLPWPHHVLALRGLAAMTEGVEAGQLVIGGYGGSSLIDNVDVRALGGIRMLPVRSHAPEAAARVVGGHVEWRLPLEELQVGWGPWPLYANRLAGVCFADAGWHRSERELGGSILAGIGAELRLQSQIAYLPFEWRLGTALPVAGGQGLRGYFEIGTFF